MSNERAERELTDAEIERVALYFRLLSEPMRLKILQAVCKKERPVNEIVAAVGATQANISKHLSLLAMADVLTRRKSGQRVYYGIKSPLLLQLCALVHSEFAD